MSNTPRDGGPAFPRIAMLGDVVADFAGMSLRDYFAAQALTGILAGRNWIISGHDSTADLPQTAAWAYKWADAMLAERTK